MLFYFILSKRENDRATASSPEIVQKPPVLSTPPAGPGDLYGKWLINIAIKTKQKKVTTELQC